MPSPFRYNEAKVAQTLRDLLDSVAPGVPRNRKTRAAEKRARELLGELDSTLHELNAAAILVHAYLRGESRGGSVDWDDLNRAYEKALAELGPERVTEIRQMYAYMYREENGDENADR